MANNQPGKIEKIDCCGILVERGDGFSARYGFQ